MCTIKRERESEKDGTIQKSHKPTTMMKQKGPFFFSRRKIDEVNSLLFERLKILSYNYLICKRWRLQIHRLAHTYIHIIYYTL